MKFKELNGIYRIFFCLCICIITLCISGLFQWDSDPVIGLDKMSGDFLITLFCLFLMYKSDLIKKAGFQRKGFMKGIVLGIPFYIIGALSLIVSNNSLDWSAMKWNGRAVFILFFFNMLFVGINEEILMRGFVFTYLEAGYAQDKNPTKKAIVISAIIFGMIHLSNVFFMDAMVVFVQVINAVSAGILFAAIFSRTRNIWANIIIHTSVDFMALFVEKCFTGGNSVLSMHPNEITAIILIICGSLPPLVVSYIYEKM